MTSPPRRPLGLAATIGFLAIMCVIEWWAVRAADPDFPLPDPFHGLAIVLLVAFGLTALVQKAWLRITLLTLIYALPAAILFAEWRAATRDTNIINTRIALSKDALLRYTYRPGTTIYGRTADDPPMTVTSDGLWDVPHAIPKPADVDRVVVLGDSVPNDAAVPFARRFPHRLEELLKARAPAGRRPEVVNVSCEGYNTIQEERLLEKVGLKYEPRVVVVAYVLNDPFLQNGGYRRLGNSFFAFRLSALFARLRGERPCQSFAALHDGYPFELAVRNSLERLRMVAERDRFDVVVAALPLLQPFDDAACLATYDKVIAAARDQGFATDRVVDAFAGEDYQRYLKPAERGDIIHPNAAGHERIAESLANAIAARLWPR